MDKIICTSFFYLSHVQYLLKTSNTLFNHIGICTCLSSLYNSLRNNVQYHNVLKSFSLLSLVKFASNAR